MPEYQYTDGVHTTAVIHPMLFMDDVNCTVCGTIMWRKPQIVGVIWNGLPPHLTETLSPEMNDIINNGDRRRDEYKAKKEAERND